MSYRCPYCMSELDINKIKYYVKVENEPSSRENSIFGRTSFYKIICSGGNGECQKKDIRMLSEKIFDRKESGKPEWLRTI